MVDLSELGRELLALDQVKVGLRSQVDYLIEREQEVRDERIRVESSLRRIEQDIHRFILERVNHDQLEQIQRTKSPIRAYATRR